MKKRHSEARLFDRLSELAHRMKQVKVEAERLWVFPHDRDLLECSNCESNEDVDIHGFPFAYFEDCAGKDTGLRLKEEANSVIQCPKGRRKIFAENNHFSNSLN